MKNNSRNKISRYVAFIVLIFITLSCSDGFFEQQAGNRIDPEKHFQSTIDLSNSYNGLFVPLQQAVPNLIMSDGLRSDLMDVTSNADANLRDINEHNNSVNNPYLNAADFYKVIINVNEILKNLYRVQKIDPNYDEYNVKYSTGAFIGIRSWCYLTLARMYGEVAIIDDNMTSLPANAQKFLSKNDLIDTLINQITPYVHTDLDLEEIYFPRSINTKALLGELYLEKNDYANAAIYLKLAIESYGNAPTTYKVDKTYSKDAWKNIFISSDDKVKSNIDPEIISVVPFSSTEGQYNPLTTWMYYNDKYLVKPTQLLIDAYQSQIQAKGGLLSDVNRGIGYTIDTVAGGEAYISKYSLDEGLMYSTDIIILRAADIHLMLAEALNRMGNHSMALLLLNNGINSLNPKPEGYTLWRSNIGIRGRVLLSPVAVPVEITDEAAITETIEDLIMEERVLELAYEGKRWFDLMRVAKRRGNPDYLASKVAAKFSDPSKAQQIREKLQNEANWYLPIR
jgi:tetratricopeptide (TPR) repeat protein